MVLDLAAERNLVALDPQQVLGLVVLDLVVLDLVVLDLEARSLVQQEVHSLDLVVRQQVQQVQTAESVRQLAETRSYLEVLCLARCSSRNDLA